MKNFRPVLHRSSLALVPLLASSSAFATGAFDALSTTASSTLTDATTAIMATGGYVAIALLSIAGLTLLYRVFRSH